MTTSESLFEIRQGSLLGPAGAVLAGLELRARSGAVTVVLGPAGTGKSLLLRVLAGQALPPGFHAQGEWRYRDRPLEGAAEGVLWVAQQRRGGVPAPWRGALESGSPVLLLDEPGTGAPPEEMDALVEGLGGHARSGGAAVVVTHDLAFARRVADHAWLLCAGRVVAAQDAPGFFDDPPDALTARFLEQGNCWPSGPRAPELPPHFHWIRPGEIAGMGRPGLMGEMDQDLEAIAAAGVSLLVTLTEDSLPAEKLRSVGLQGRHFPIRDMGVPAVGATASLCREMERALTRGAVAVHCHAGMGRTGTILASFLVWQGRRPEEAIAEVRLVARGYIQNRAQADFVRRFADAVGPAVPSR